MTTDDKPLPLLVVAYFLKLRLRIFGRLLLEAGIWRVVLLGLSVFAGLAYLITVVSSAIQAYLLAGFVVSVIGSIHLSRGDGRFLKILGAPAWQLYTAEYMVYAIPVAAVLLAVGQPFPSILILLGCAGLPVFRLAGNAATSECRYRSWIPFRAFEWVAGLRKTRLAFVPIYVAGAVFAAYPFSVPVALVVLVTLATTYYHFGEGRAMLEVFGLQPGALLRKKMRQSLGVFWVICAPLAMTHLVLNPTDWELLLVVAMGCSILLITAVLAKYAFFVEGVRFTNPHAVIISVSLTCMLLFIFSPVAVGLAWWLYYRAKSNLTVQLATGSP